MPRRTGRVFFPGRKRVSAIDSKVTTGLLVNQERSGEVLEFGAVCPFLPLCCV